MEAYSFFVKVFRIYEKYSYPRKTLLSKKNIALLREYLTTKKYANQLDEALTSGFYPDIYIDGETPFSMAMQASRIDYGCVLLHYGASPFGCKYTLNVHTLHFDYDVYLDMLIERGYDLNKLQDGTTLLHTAVDYRNVGLIEYLTKHVRTNIKDKKGYTPLEMLVGEDTASIVVALMRS